LELNIDTLHFILQGWLACEISAQIEILEKVKLLDHN